MAMEIITPGYLSKRKAEVVDSSESQMWTELEDLHTKRLSVLKGYQQSFSVVILVL